MHVFNTFRTLRPRASLAAGTLLVILLLRAVTLGAMPLLDPSETRYALVARLMLEQHNIITPQLFNHEGLLEPFWAKPPLFFWFNAFCFWIFGLNEGVARLPSFLSMLLTLSAVFVCTRTLLCNKAAWTSVLLLSTSGVFFVYSGLCQMDMTLAAAVAWTYCALVLWFHDSARRNIWMLIMAFSLACGFLIKGPVAIALPMAGILPWLFTVRKELLGQQFRDFPRWTFLAIVFTLVAPWFLFAERDNPGFLRYFFINENLLRFFAHDYGDRYGSSHRYPFGTIWFFLLLATLPWGLFAFLLPQFRLALQQCWRDPWRRFAILWGISPGLLFTFAHSILPSYVLPGIPGLAMIAALELHRTENVVWKQKITAWAQPIGLLFLAVALFSVVALFAQLPTDSHPPQFELLLHMNLMLIALAILVFAMRALRLRRWPQEFLTLSAGCALFVAQTAAGVITAPTVPSATYASYLDQRFPSKSYEVNFPFGIPYSAYLYLPNRLECDQTELHTAEDSLFHEAVMIPKSKAAEFEQLTGNSIEAFHLIAHLGRWSVFERLNRSLGKPS